MPGEAAFMTSDPPEETLRTIRDWLRFAVTQFNTNNLVYGHGTGNAVDEAAYLIQHTLNLPIDAIDPWLDCHILASESRAIAKIISKRIESRKPASYLTNEAWIGGHSFYVDERVIVPRSYLGELLNDGLVAAIGETNPERILDLCTGSGCLAVLAALAFPDAHVDASDISQEALDVARRNIRDYGLEDRISPMQSDLFDGLPPRQYDVILANPPYVTDAAIRAFPPEYAAEPALAHAGGRDGMDLVRRLLAGAEQRLTAAGSLLVEIGSGRLILERDYPNLPFLWLDTKESEGEVFALTAAALQEPSC
jgi:ribosomal protein L3 glutamine methyltransferase